MIELKGIAWDHPRGYEPLIAASKEYKKHNSDVNIKWDVRSLKEFGDMPIEQLIERYDLITIDHPYMGQAHKSGLLLKLEEHLSDEKLKNMEAEALGKCFSIYHYNQHLYATPIDAAALVAAYRKDKFAELGVKIPFSRQELKRFCKQLPSDYKVAWALCPTDIWCTFLSLCAQNVGEGFISERTINAQVGTDVLDEIKSYLDFLHPDSLKWNPIQILDKMGAEDEIIYCPYLFGYTNYSREGYSKNLLHFTNSPIGQRENISTIMGGVGLAVSALTKQPEVASDFAQYVAGAQIQSGIFTEKGGQPANRKAWENENNNVLCGDFFNDTKQTIQNAYIRPQHPGWNEFQEHCADLIHEGILKNTASEVIMKQLNDLYKTI